MGRKRKASAVIAALALGIAAVAATAPGALAGKPEMQRFDIDVVFADTFLSGECGVAVTTRQRGHIILRSFDREKGLVEVNTLNFALTATAGDNTYRFRDVGADRVEVTADGPILSIVGQIPFDFNGVLKINLDTNEVVHEPRASKAGRVDKACAALTA
jgi:hypothetical protein